MKKKKKETTKISCVLSTEPTFRHPLPNMGHYLKDLPVSSADDSLNNQINQKVELSNRKAIIELFDMYGSTTHQEFTNFLMEMQEELISKNTGEEAFVDSAIVDFMFKFRMLAKLVTGLSDPRDFTKKNQKVA
jgi:hypothetical protein